MSAALLVSLAGCSDFLERPSLTVMDDNNYWSSEDNVRLFVNSAYGSYFTGYSASWSQVYAPGTYSAGEYSDDRTQSGTQTNILLTVPADNWYKAEAATGYWLARRGSGPWNFAYIRKWNLLIDRLDLMKEGGKLTEEAYNHWMGVARFFRGWEYSRFVESFGDVPYYDHVVATDDLDEMYKDRDPRTTVMDGVKADFDFAIANVRANDGKDYVNHDVVATIASRCMLFEGTWYIYHKTDAAMKTAEDIDGHAKTYLTAAMQYAQSVVDSGKYTFNTDSHTLFGNLYTSLTGTAGEVILYRAYNKSVNNSEQHAIASYSGGHGGNENQITTGNLSTLKAWICADGKPYTSTTVENADSWKVQDLAVTRDARFESTFFDLPHQANATTIYVHKFINRTGLEYGWNGLAVPACYASCTNENGYPCVRYAETVLNWLEAKAELAEHFGGAAITQADLDKSINAIRTRPLDDVAIAKGVKQTAPLQLAWVNDSFDPERTSDAQKACHSYAVTGKFVSPILWEIRRERRMEFFDEQYRVLDIRRWGQLELMNADTNPDIMLGAYVDLNSTKTQEKKAFDWLNGANMNVVSVRPLLGKNADGTLKLGDRVFFTGTKDESGNILSSNADQMVGFVVPKNFKNRDERNFLERNYLEPICTDVISQYKEQKYTITQNPGWE